MSTNSCCLKKIEESCSGDPKGHWDSAQTTSSTRRSNSGNESHVCLLKQIMTGRKRLMAVEFSRNLDAHAKARSLKISSNSVVDPCAVGMSRETMLMSESEARAKKLNLVILGV